MPGDNVPPAAQSQCQHGREEVPGRVNQSEKQAGEKPKHEGGAEEEHPNIDAQTAYAGPLGHEQQNHPKPEPAQQQHRANGQGGDHPVADIEERPVVRGELRG